MGKFQAAVASACWCCRKAGNQALSWRALAVFYSVLLLPTIERKVGADLADETGVLLEIKRIWKNPPQLNSWSNDTSTCDEWLGVTCDVLNTTIDVLELNFLLDSEIPPVLGNLTNLSALNLSECNLIGEIPKSIGSMKNLRMLDLGYNLFNGSIPLEFGNLTNLTSLSLYGNNLEGTLPDLSRLQSLEFLDLGYNLFNGNIPLEFGNLTNLTSLSLYGNNLKGTLPDLSRLQSLEVLNLRYNKLTGRIPLELGNLTNLTSLNLGYNALSGSIPLEFGKLTKLTYLNLRNNALNGSIPLEFGNLTNLTSLILNENYLTGTLPDLSRLLSLEFLDLARNYVFTGPLPSWLGGLSQLQHLSFIFTNLRGSIPPEIGNLTNLITLGLESCGLSGVLPPELGNLISLSTMILNENHLNGSLGSWIGDLYSLSEIVLDDNSIQGALPPELGNLLNLTMITASNNQLSGKIPASLGNLINLETLALQKNFLTGSVPPSILSLPNLIYLTLDNNCLNGSTPVNQTNSNMESSYNGNCFSESSSSLPCHCDAEISPPPDTQLLGNGGSNGNNSKINISVGVVVGTLVTLAVLIIIYLRCRRRPHKELTPPPGSVSCYRLSQIKEATKNFTTNIGKGGQATVYRAQFNDGRVAAIKRFGHDLEHRRKDAVKTFDQEVSLLARLNHRFLVNVTGYCKESGEYMLLFEYMNEGSLYDHLHGIHAARTSLTWEERVVILFCVACGVDYLHYGCSPPVFHRDIKSANILLSSEPNFIAKVADFGLGKLTTIDPQGDDVDVTARTPKPEPTNVMGSHGYMDPYYLRRAIYSEKSDIYSYGVVLLELITGRKALEKGKLSLTEWVSPYLEEPKEILQIVDPKMEGKLVEEELFVVVEIARSCIDPRPSNRPTIRDILQKLRSVFKKQTTMISPPQRTTSSADFSGNQSNLSVNVLKNSIYSYTESEILPRD